MDVTIPGVIALAVTALVFVHGLYVSTESDAVRVYVDIDHPGGDHEERRVSVSWRWYEAFVDRHTPATSPLRAFVARAHAPGRTWTIKKTSGCMLLESDKPTYATYWATGDAGRQLYAACVTEIDARDDAARNQRKRTLWGVCRELCMGSCARVARAFDEPPRAPR